MCSRGDRGCHNTESSCHSGGSSCHDRERSCHGSEEVICHEVSAVQDVTPVVVLPPQGPVVTVPGQVPVAPAPCLQQQQIKQPVQWPPQQQK
ncbi:white-opaque regulator 2-like [Strigops habroptila]|uniref:White-opaque regulator 2-like n=1 Tax=Strigops habroptila TaxID=2489341 RepID=A0A672UYI6_STRHB|nr:white-opaque regulator 2-like [Strigops habroptila]